MGAVITFAVLLLFAYANAYASIIGVKQRSRGGMRLEANDAGFYIPRHWGVEGFFRGLYINAFFAASSTAVLTLTLPGEPFRLGKELMLFAAVINLALSFIVACIIPSEFGIIFLDVRWRVWRVVVIGTIGAVVYFATSVLIAFYLSSLPTPVG